MNKESNGTSLKELFQGMIPREIELMQGIVISEEPLRIQAVNDSKLIISRISTVIPQQLKDYTVSVTINDETGEHEAEITVHNALKTGDMVHLFAVQNGKKYFVLGRV